MDTAREPFFDLVSALRCDRPYDASAPYTRNPRPILRGAVQGMICAANAVFVPLKTKLLRTVQPLLTLTSWCWPAAVPNAVRGEAFAHNHGSLSGYRLIEAMDPGSPTLRNNSDARPRAHFPPMAPVKNLA